MLYCNNDGYMRGTFDECSFASAKSFASYWKAATGKSIILYKRIDEKGFVEFIDEAGDVVLESGDLHEDVDFDFPSADDRPLTDEEEEAERLNWRTMRLEDRAESMAWERAQYR